jgi:eukaryotic-like serine/threonine-protein kinase
VKPANVMVGVYGEVVLMDWGIARAIDGKEPAPVMNPSADAAEPSGGTTRRRLVQTAQAQLIGTPAYMAPEQAQGRTDLDARCDLYAASVVFHELMTLQHYLHDTTSVTEMLGAVVERPLPAAFSGAYAHPTQGPIPAEYIHFLRQGMSKSRDQRFASAQEMIARLEEALEGKIRVQCPVTMTKRVTREAGRFVDRRPKATAYALLGSALAIVVGLGTLVAALLR